MEPKSDLVIYSYIFAIISEKDGTYTIIVPDLNIKRSGFKVYDNAMEWSGSAIQDKIIANICHGKEVAGSSREIIDRDFGLVDGINGVKLKVASCNQKR